MTLGFIDRILVDATQKRGSCQSPGKRVTGTALRCNRDVTQRTGASGGGLSTIIGTRTGRIGLVGRIVLHKPGAQDDLKLKCLGSRIGGLLFLSTDLARVAPRSRRQLSVLKGPGKRVQLNREIQNLRPRQLGIQFGSSISQCFRKSSRQKIEILKASGDFHQRSSLFGRLLSRDAQVRVPLGSRHKNFKDIVLQLLKITEVCH